MLGTSSVPHWFRRAISLLNTEIPSGRTAGGARRAREAAEQRRLAVRRRAHGWIAGSRRGPRELEEIVLSWEQQQARKARAAGARAGHR